MKQQTFLTEKQAAKILKIPERTLARLRRDPGTIPPVPHSQLGNNIRYDPELLFDWVKSYNKKTETRPVLPKQTDSQFVRLS